MSKYSNEGLYLTFSCNYYSDFHQGVTPSSVKMLNGFCCIKESRC